MKSPATDTALSTGDWLLAETVRRAEERAGSPFDSAEATQAGKLAGGDLAARILARDQHLPEAGTIRDDIRRLAGIMRIMVTLLAIAGLASGIAAAAISVGEDRRVDILLALVTLLGLPTAMLAAWVIMLGLSWRRPRRVSLAGRVLRSVSGWLAARLLTSPHRQALIAAAGDLLGQGSLARWGLSGLTHLFWTAYAAAALATLAVLFAVLQYDLAWGTTLLTDATVVDLVDRLGYLPGLMVGAPVPDAELILASRAGTETGAGRAVWARFLLAGVLVYGLLPRLVLGLGCLALFRRARGRLKLDLDHPGYLRLAPELMPSGQAHPPEKPRTRTSDPDLPTRPRKRPDSAGTPILIGVELDRPAERWPPMLPGIESRVLGRADDRGQVRALAAALEALQRPPSHLIALCALGRTPDKGTERALNALANAAGAPLILVVDETERFSESGGRINERFGQWRRLATRLGAEAVLLELDRPDAAALARLKSLLEDAEPAE